MTDTVHKQILDEIGSRLANVSIANGYNSEALKITRAQITPFKTNDLPRCNYWASTDRLIEQLYANCEMRSLLIIAEVYAKTRDQSFIDVSYELSADIWSALNRSTISPEISDSVSAKLGGIVQGIYLDTITPLIGEGQAPWCGAILEIDVQYKIKRNNPFTLIP